MRADENISLPEKLVVDQSHILEFEGLTLWYRDQIIAHVVDDQHGNAAAHASEIARRYNAFPALESENLSLREALERAFFALGQAGGNVSGLEKSRDLDLRPFHADIRKAWLDARTVLSLIDARAALSRKDA